MKKFGMVYILLCHIWIYADTLKDLTDVEKLTKTSMQYIGEDKLEKGLAVLAPYSVVSHSQFDNLKKQIIEEFPKFRVHFGKVIGSEHVGKTHVGKSLCQITYIQKFEKHILSWHFDYYKPKEIWVLSSFEMADSMGALFEVHGEKR